jgi:hypothetical protein
MASPTCGLRILSSALPNTRLKLSAPVLNGSVYAQKFVVLAFRL